MRGADDRPAAGLANAGLAERHVLHTRLKGWAVSRPSGANGCLKHQFHSGRKLTKLDQDN